MKRSIAVELPDDALEEVERGKDLVRALETPLDGTRNVVVLFQREVGR